MASRAIHLDTRGIIAPARMSQFATLTRFAPPPELTGLVDWFWCVQWDLPDGVIRPQRVLPQPAVNVSVGTPPPEGEGPPPGPWPLRTTVNGVATGMTTRALSGRGFNLAAKTTTGGFGAWVDDVSALTDRHRTGAEVLGMGDEVARGVADVVGHEPERGVHILATALLAALDRRPAQRIATTREVAAVAALAESDRMIRRLDDLAAAAGYASRTLQRLFSSCVGVSPTWVIRRFRLLEAADLVRHGEQVSWAEVAADLGYADQAHLVRDFTANIGISPGAYARAQHETAGRTSAGRGGAV